MSRSSRRPPVYVLALIAILKALSGMQTRASFTAALDDLLSASSSSRAPQR